MSNPLTCREIWRRRQEEWRDMQERYENDTAAALPVEFPIGSIAYIAHGSGKLKVQVQAHGPDWNKVRVTVRNVETKKIRDVEAKDLEKEP